jgi:hypothetical protein
MATEVNFPLVEAFYDICVEEGNTTSIEAIRNAAFQKLGCGEAKSLVSTSLNGKSFSYNISQPAEALFAAASLAIRRFNRGFITVTYSDLSGI